MILGLDAATRTTKALAEASGRLTDLRARGAAALTGDDLRAIKKADDDIRAEEHTITILQDKLRAQDQQRRKERQEDLERQKAAALATLERFLRTEAEAAVKVVEGLSAVGRAYAAYKEIRNRPRPWSSTLHNPNALPIGLGSLLSRLVGRRCRSTR
jgi:hypothetical protein